MDHFLNQGAFQDDTETKRNYYVSSCFFERVSNQTGSRSVALSSKTSQNKVTKIREVVVFEDNLPSHSFCSYPSFEVVFRVTT